MIVDNDLDSGNASKTNRTSKSHKHDVSRHLTTRHGVRNAVVLPPDESLVDSSMTRVLLLGPGI